HDLTQRDVEAADAAPDRRGERAFDADEVVEERLDRLLGQPVARRVEGFLTREHLVPVDRLAVLGGCGVEHHLRPGPDVDAGAVTFDERDDGLVGNAQDAVDERDLLSHGPDRTGAFRTAAQRASATISSVTRYTATSAAAHHHSARRSKGAGRPATPAR